eukprot:gnl/TRDRNA2_/TRDRNA2_132701_c2_seq1.p1 gnl/TRDRNA2_/TRDRNA2_132701_c2~~gnl/TRDRNA2_/TRDRNA2_132701_c2_seq1.p1  ORF type:complete len:179 (+),score=15.71 gnl/TRDRNA2_/TRDRNA2_132701_c2_seq1:53-538(+)
MGPDGAPIFHPCPWGTYHLDGEPQRALSCEEVTAAEPELRRVATSLCAMADGSGEPDVAAGPVVDPFDHLYGHYNPWCGVDAYRYWYQYTEYATLRGLQQFTSASDLLDGLSRLLLGPEAEGNQEKILKEMREHQRVRLRETVHWWTHALLLTVRVGAGTL